jgi:hypothetical protein
MRCDWRGGLVLRVNCRSDRCGRFRSGNRGASRPLNPPLQFQQVAAKAVVYLQTQFSELEELLPNVVQPPE